MTRDTPPPPPPRPPPLYSPTPQQKNLRYPQERGGIARYPAIPRNRRCDRYSYALSETGIGGVKTYRTLEGGGTCLESCLPLENLDFLTSKLAILYRNSVERGQFQGPLEIQNFHPPSNFRRFDPPYPGLQPYSAVGGSQCWVTKPVYMAVPIAMPGLKQPGLGTSKSLPSWTIKIHARLIFSRINNCKYTC